MADLALGEMKEDEHDSEPKIGDSERPPSEAGNKPKRGRPDFENLYLYTGYAMFNHGCSNAANATWWFDEVIPNRIMVRTTKDVKEGAELRLQYLPDEPEADRGKRKVRLFGRPCDCGTCPAPEDSEHSEDGIPSIPSV